MTKICSKCKCEYPLDCFHKRKNAKDWHNCVCKYCRNEYNKSFFKNNSDSYIKRKQYEKEYYQKNKDRLSEYYKNRLKNNPLDPIMKRLRNYVNYDKKRWLINDLTYDFIKEQTSLPCVYCWSIGNIWLDRIDNSLWHSIDNVVPCCSICNNTRMHIRTHEEMFVLWKTIKILLDSRAEN